jgi:adenine deaminase
MVMTYGGQFQLQPNKPELAEPEYFFADTRDEMRKAVRENVHFGARVIKVAVDDQRYIYSEEDIRFIVDEVTELPGLTRGSTAMQWVDSYLAAGLAPKDILRAMTATAARALGVEKQRGAMRPGMIADLIATRVNPLEDLNALKQVGFVMKNGRVIKELKP